MRIPFNKKWIIFEREDYANYLFVVKNWEGYSYMPIQWKFTPARFLGAEYVDASCTLFMPKDDLELLNAKHFEYLFNKPELWDKLHYLTEVNTKKLFKLSREIKSLKTKILSDKSLLIWIGKFQQGQASVHVPRGPMWMLETPTNIVSNYLHNYLSEKEADHKHIKTKPFEAFRILATTTRKSIWAEEKEALIKVALEKKLNNRAKKLKAHTKKYEWLEYGLQGKILSLSHFEDELKIIIKQGPLKMLQQYKKEKENTIKKQQQIINEYNIDRSHQKIFHIVQDSFYTRLFSKDSQFFGYYCLEGLLKEFGRRVGLSLEQVRFLAPKDFSEALLTGKDVSRLAGDNRRYSLHFSDKGKTVFYSGDKAKKIRKKLKFYQENEQIYDKEQLNGQPAFAGKVRGKVKIINTIPEMAKMHSGNVLVSHMTNPGIVPVMKQAIAIVTDLGGITCHAAIVARELKKPCIIGTKVATKVFKDGDMVEVDANKGIVRRIK